MKILFSILKYKLITNESINIGILFHNLDTDERRLETISKWSRVKNFDDEINIKYFRILLGGIKEEVSSTLWNNNVEFNISKYTRLFCNEMRFSQIYEDNTSNFTEFIEYNKKIFLRYDYEKRERLNRDQQVSHIKKLMKSNEVKYSVKKVLGEYYENIQYDYVVGEFAYKFFSFENKNLDNLVHTAKAWAYTSQEMKSIYKTVFVYDVELVDKKFDMILNILNKSAYKVVSCDNILDFVMGNYKDKEVMF